MWSIRHKHSQRLVALREDTNGNEAFSAQLVNKLNELLTKLVRLDKPLHSFFHGRAFSDRHLHSYVRASDRNDFHFSENKISCSFLIFTIVMQHYVQMFKIVIEFNAEIEPIPTTKFRTQRMFWVLVFSNLPKLFGEAWNSKNWSKA